ncbi:MAG: ATP-binding protein [Bacteroidales bacterium]|nr:ATP-binding protein [Bacteroidales bacterium]
MNLQKRDAYYSQISKWLSKGLAIVLTGQRRVGKSCMLKQLKEEKEHDASNNVIYIDLEDSHFQSITDYQQLNEYIDGLICDDKHNYILIDEIQEVEAFERSVRYYIKRENTDVLITGSNAHMLSSDLSTMLAGRYVEIHIQSLSYSEFLQFNGLDDNDQSLMRYMTLGGLPQLCHLGIGNNEIVEDYLKNIYNTILLKDIISREKIRNIPFLTNLCQFISDNIGKLISATSISNYMKSQRADVSSNVVISYLSYFCNAYVIDKVSRYDIHGKRLFEINDKYYFGDIGIRNILSRGTRQNDIEKIIENVVYLHLKSMHYNVYVGQLRSSEIDFVAQKPDKTVYIQCSYLIASPETYNREFGNLKMIKDNHPKIVVSLNPMLDEANEDGIRHIHLRRFLMLGEL